MEIIAPEVNVTAIVIAVTAVVNTPLMETD